MLNTVLEALVWHSYALETDRTGVHDGDGKERPTTASTGPTSVPAGNPTIV